MTVDEPERITDDDAHLIVWNLRTGEAIQDIHEPFHGPIGAAAWTTIGDDNNDAWIVFGCANGNLIVYNRKERHVSRAYVVYLRLVALTATKGKFTHVSIADGHGGGPVEDMKFDSKHHRLATCGGSHVQVWKFTAEGERLFFSSLFPARSRQTPSLRCPRAKESLPA